MSFWTGRGLALALMVAAVQCPAEAAAVAELPAAVAEVPVAAQPAAVAELPVAELPAAVDHWASATYQHPMSGRLPVPWGGFGVAGWQWVVS